MNPIIKGSTTLLLGAVIATVALVAPTASATTNPLTLRAASTQIDAGTSPSFTYYFHRKDWAYGRKELQRQFGTKHLWTDIVRLHHQTRTIKAPALQMGKYNYRIALYRFHKLQATSATVTVYSYATVPMSCGCGGTEQVGSTIFTYTDYVDGWTYPNYEQNQVGGFTIGLSAFAPGEIDGEVTTGGAFVEVGVSSCSRPAIRCTHKPRQDRSAR